MKLLHLGRFLGFLFALGLSPVLLAKTDETIHHMAQPPISSNQIIDLSNQEILSFSDFISNIAQADQIILGEYHDHVNQHILATQLLDSLQKIRPQGSLILEMLTVGQQNLVNQAQQNPPKDLDKLTKSLDWQKSWRWDLYGDIVKRPFLYGYPLIASNLNKSEIFILMQGAEPLKGYDSTKPWIKQHIFATIVKNHGMQSDNMNASDKQMIHNMVEIQQFRDRRMAEKLLSSPKPTLLLAGNYHAQKDIGVPIHLQDLIQDLPDNHPNKQAKAVVIMMLSNADELKDINQYQADFAWIIPELKSKNN